METLKREGDLELAALRSSLEHLAQRRLTDMLSHRDARQYELLCTRERVLLEARG